MTALLCVLIFLFIILYLGKQPIPLFSGAGISGIFLTVILPLYIVAQMKLNYKTTSIDTDLKEISFKMFLLPIKRTYRFDYFDGYVETLVKDKYESYKCFYLVKDGKLKYKISGRFYSNINDLKEGLASLKYLGFIKYTFPLSIKIALNKTIL